MSETERLRPVGGAVRPKPVSSMLAVTRRLAPGLLLALFIAVFARLISSLSYFLPDMVVALVVGATLNNILPEPRSFSEGLRFTHRYLLRTAIILLGVSFSFATVARTGDHLLAMIAICFVLSFSLCWLAARLTGLSEPIGTLLASGTAICVATAILTIGPLIAATEAEIAYAVTTIFTYNTLAVIFYPVIGNVPPLRAQPFGVWSGTSVNDTSAVIPTGYIFGDAAGLMATVVKLTRTVLLVPLALLVGLGYGMRRDKGSKRQNNFAKTMP